MADRKGRSGLLKFAYEFNSNPNLRDLRSAIEEAIESEIIVFQDLGSSEFLVELDAANDAEKLTEEGFDFGDSHVTCHPPHGQSVNVSIMGLRSYIADEDVKEALTQYGEIKGEVIRLKYKADHELAGLQNGNRLVKMVLSKKSIPYSLRIEGEWCRVIHNDQQPICSECQELGHTRKKCPEIVCRICKEKGHMSYACEKRNVSTESEEADQQAQNMSNEEPKEPVNVETNQGRKSEPSSNTESADNPTTTEQRKHNNPEAMETQHSVQGCKRQLSGDSDDSDDKVQSRRTKINPVPNFSHARSKSKEKSTKENRR